MSLRLILGRAGAGKTHLCLREVRERLEQSPVGPALILLVPEQASLQTERELLRRSGQDGFFRAQVLSFRRLAWRVFQETGGLARPHLGELGKRMALRAILEKRLAELKLFAPLARQPGFAEKLAHTITEMRLYGVAPESLRQAWERLAEANASKAGGTAESVASLELKLHDLYLVYRDLEYFLANRYLDPDDYLALLAQRLPEATFLRDAEVWVDGFTGFTPQEDAVLEALFSRAARVNLTLTLAPELAGKTLDEAHLFHPTALTFQRLVGLARKKGIRLEETVVLPAPTTDGLPRFSASPSLAHLEASFGQWPLRPYQRGAGNVMLVAAANRRVEVEAVARRCIHLVRDKGLRWRDLAIMVRDLEPYHDLVVNVFRDYGIPFFIDRRRPVGHHPLLELIRSALEIVLEDWSYDAVFRFLKTDLVPLSREAVDRLENYVLEHGIKGRRQWTDGGPWLYRSFWDLTGDESGRAVRRAPTPGQEANGQPPGEDPVDLLLSPELKFINDTRTAVVGFLARFVQEVDRSAPQKVRSLSTALFNLLLELEVPRTLDKWRAQAEAEGDLDAAQEHEQVWNGLVDVFDQLVEAAGDENLNLEEFAQVLEAGLQALRVGLIPPALDQVTVGSLDRSRPPEIKVAFLLGANEGVFPARVTEDEIFTDAEREKLQGTGLELAPTGRQQLFHEQFLAYLAFTRASQELWVSYSLADDEGEALAPSPLLRWLKQVFPRLEEQTIGPEPVADDLELLSGERPAVGHLVRILGETMWARAKGEVGAEAAGGKWPPGEAKTTGVDQAGASTEPGLSGAHRVATMSEQEIEKSAAGPSKSPDAGHDRRNPGDMAISNSPQPGSPLLPVLWREVYRWVVGSAERRRRWAPLLRGLLYEGPPDRLPRELVEGLYLTREAGPGLLRTSVSRLETFAACPFGHLARYGLRLQERALYQVDAPSMGLFYHAALRRFVEILEERGEDWGQLSPEKTRVLLQEIFTELTGSLKYGILTSTSRYVYLKRRFHRVLLRSLEVLQEHARRSRFRPLKVEVSFGRDGFFPAPELELGEGRRAILEGRIDRVDLAVVEDAAGQLNDATGNLDQEMGWSEQEIRRPEQDTRELDYGTDQPGPGNRCVRLYLRVIDYKSSATNLRPEKLYHGLSLQLWLYLRVALEIFARDRSFLKKHGGERLLQVRAGQGPPPEFIGQEVESGTSRKLLTEAQEVTGEVLPAGILYFVLGDPILKEKAPLDEEELAARRRKHFRMTGLLLKDPEVIRLMDAAAERGELLPARLRADGTLDQRSSAVALEEFQLLLELAWSKAQELLKRIMEGEVSPHPYRLGNETPCNRCPYRGVCGFDLRLPGNTYRKLKPLKWPDLMPRAQERQRQGLLRAEDEWR